MDIPENKTCETCDWWCYGTWPGNTCDKWEYTIMEIEIPDEIIDILASRPTKQDLHDLHKEIEDLERNTGERS